MAGAAAPLRDKASESPFAACACERFERRLDTTSFLRDGRARPRSYALPWSSARDLAAEESRADDQALHHAERATTR